MLTLEGKLENWTNASNNAIHVAGMIVVLSQQPHRWRELNETMEELATASVASVNARRIYELAYMQEKLAKLDS